RARSLAVQLERLERRSAHVGKWWRILHRAERLADLAAQSLAQLAHGRDQLGRTVRGALEGRELVARGRGHDARGHEEAGTERREVSGDDGLGSGARGDLERELRVNLAVW